MPDRMRGGSVGLVIVILIVGSLSVSALRNEFTYRDARIASPATNLGDVGLVVAPGNQTSPQLWGNFLAWEDDRIGRPQVYLMNLTIRVVSSRPNPLQEQRFPRFGEGLLLFVQTSTRCTDKCVWVVNAQTGSVTTHSKYGGMDPVVPVGGRYAYVDGLWPPGEPSGLFTHWLSNGTFEGEWSVPAEHPDGGGGNGPVAGPGVIVLSIRSMRPSGLLCTRDKYACVNELGVVYTSNRTFVPITNSLQLFRAITPNPYCYDFTDEVFPAISGNTVVWQDNRNSKFAADPYGCLEGNHWDIYGFDLATWKEFPLLTNPWNETHSAVDENLLVWQDDRNGNWDIYGMWLDTRKVFQITDDPAAQINPVVSKGCVAWQDDRNGTWDIYGTCSYEKKPPVANAGGPYTGFEGSRITFNAGASTDPDGDTLKFRWDFYGNGTWNTDWSSSPYATYTYGDDWSGKARVEVSDGTSTATATSNVTVNNVAPTPSIDAACQGHAHGLTPCEFYPLDNIIFNGSAIDPGSDDLMFTWDFGDGTVVAGPPHYNNGVSPDPYLIPSGTFPFAAKESVDHAYALPGDYTLTLTATDDDDGVPTTSMTIHVTSPMDLKHEAIQRIKALKMTALARGDTRFVHELNHAEEEVWESLGYEHPFKPESVSASLAPDVTAKKVDHDKVELTFGPSWESRLASYSAIRLTWANGDVTAIDLPAGWPTKDLHAHVRPWVDAWQQDVRLDTKHGKKGPLTLTVHAHQVSLGVTVSLDADKVADLSFTYEIRHWWDDGSHLDPKQGNHVFSEEKHAVKLLVKHGKPEPKPKDVRINVCRLDAKRWTTAERASLNAECDAIANLLVKADGVLAQIALAQASDTRVNDTKHAKDVQHELDEAQRGLAKAHEDWDAHEYDRAIDHFKKAWEHAQHAIRGANR